MRRWVAVVPLVVGVFVVAGCDGGDPPSEGVSSPGVSVSSIVPVPTDEPSSPSPGPGVPSDVPSGTVFEPPAEGLTEEQLEIREAVISYWRVHDKYAGDHSLEGFEEEAKDVATPEEANGLGELIQQYRDQGWVVHGGILIRGMAFDDDPSSASEGSYQAQLHYCVDQTETYGRDATTGEFFQFTPGTLYESVTMERSDDGRWRVQKTTNVEEAC